MGHDSLKRERAAAKRTRGAFANQRVKCPKTPIEYLEEGTADYTRATICKNNIVMMLNKAGKLKGSSTANKEIIEKKLKKVRGTTVSIVPHGALRCPRRTARGRRNKKGELVKSTDTLFAEQIDERCRNTLIGNTAARYVYVK